MENFTSVVSGNVSKEENTAAADGFIALAEVLSSVYNNESDINNLAVTNTTSIYTADLANSTLDPSATPTVMPYYADWFRIFTTVLGAVGLIINALNIIVISGIKKQRKSCYNNYRTFMFIIAVADMVGSFWLGMFSFDHLYHFMEHSRVLCVLSATTLHTSYIFLSLVMIIISVERLLAIVRPMEYGQTLFIRKLRSILVITFILSASPYIALTAVFYEVAFEPKGFGSCKLESRHVPQIGLVTSSLVTAEFILLLLLYTALVILLKRTHRNMMVQRSRTTREITRVCCCILLAHIILWLPPHVNMVLRVLKIRVRAMEYVTQLGGLLIPIADPFIYGCTSERYRESIRLIFHIGNTVGVVSTTSGGRSNNNNTGSSSQVISTVSGHQESHGVQPSNNNQRNCTH